MKNKELKELTVKELNFKLKEERQTLTKLKFSHAVSPVENPQMIKSTRRLIARILTDLRRRQLEGATK